MTKYGKLDVYRPGQKDAPLRGLLKVPKVPPLVGQYAYDALRVVPPQAGGPAAAGALVALMPNGALHYFEWEE
jgi:hypothetical protein